MTQTNSNTNARKGKHLTDGERYQIQILLKEGYSHRHIGRVLGRNHQTINNEVKRGTVTQIDRVTSMVSFILTRKIFILPMSGKLIMMNSV